jgi:hypothetical protein
LRKEVESLLQSDGHTMGFLRNPVLDAAQQIAAKKKSFLASASVLTSCCGCWAKAEWERSI